MFDEVKIVKEEESPTLIKATAALSAVLIKADGTREDKGVIGRKMITTVFVTALADALAVAGSISTYKYHASGTGVGAEAVGDTALGTPCYDTQDGAVNSTGNQSKAAVNIYQTVCTLIYIISAAITEHGIFDQSAVSGAKLADRTKFTAINVVSGDSIQFTYCLLYTSPSPRDGLLSRMPSSA